jgi:hypothetical protein
MPEMWKRQSGAEIFLLQRDYVAKKRISVSSDWASLTSALHFAFWLSRKFEFVDCHVYSLTTKAHAFHLQAKPLFQGLVSAQFD